MSRRGQTFCDRHIVSDPAVIGDPSDHKDKGYFFNKIGFHRKKEQKSEEIFGNYRNNSYLCSVNLKSKYYGYKK